jgi:hypothetical protein
MGMFWLVHCLWPFRYFGEMVIIWTGILVAIAKNYEPLNRKHARLSEISH